MERQTDSQNDEITPSHLRAGEELVHEDAEGPEVDGPVVALVEDDLGRHVLRRAAEGPGLGARLHKLREAKVHHLDVAVRIWRTENAYIIY